MFTALHMLFVFFLLLFVPPLLVICCVVVGSVGILCTVKNIRSIESKKTTNKPNQNQKEHNLSCSLAGGLKKLVAYSDGVYRSSIVPSSSPLLSFSLCLLNMSGVASGGGPSYALYRASGLGKAFSETIEEMFHEQEMTNDQAIQALLAFDKVDTQRQTGHQREVTIDAFVIHVYKSLSLFDLAGVRFVLPLSVVCVLFRVSTITSLTSLP